VERRVDEVQEREGRSRSRGVGRRAQAPRGVSEDRYGAGAKDDRLREDEGASAGRQPPERRQQIEDGGEVVAPGVHGRKRHVGAVAVGNGPHDLDVVAKIERVGLERHMPAHDEEAHQERVRRDPRRDGAGRAHARQRERRHERAERYDRGEDDQQVLGPVDPEPTHREAPGRDHRDGQEEDAGRQRVERAGQPRHGRRVYLARRLSKRRERLQPRRWSVYQKRTARIRRP